MINFSELSESDIEKFKNETVICEVCKKELKTITNTHLKQHNLTVVQYKKLHPNSKLKTDYQCWVGGGYRVGLTYEQIHGREKSIEIKKIRSKKMEEKWERWREDPQRDIKRQNLFNEEEVKKEDRNRRKNEKIELRKRVCKQCSKEYIMSITNKNELFCCQDCFFKFSRENSTDYRTKAFALLENKCIYCEETDFSKLHVHHKDKNPYNNDIENLMIVCTKHHNHIHKGESLLSRKSSFRDGQIIRGIRETLNGLGIDLTDDNFKDTPFRILKSYYEIFEGLYNTEEIKNILETNFPSNYTGIIVAKGIHCFSMCPHHFLPVEYYIDFGYIPDGKMLGISKLTRLVELLAKQPMLQEELTFQITHILNENISPLGSIVQVRGRHFCMVMRGVKQDSWTYTNNISGIFTTDVSAKEEFQLMIKD